jgi:hypothetical protein
MGKSTSIRLSVTTTYFLPVKKTKADTKSTALTKKNTSKKSKKTD